MGVYVFRCLHAPYIKIGHHLVTRRRPNAYYRVAGRGFESVIHPPELDGLLYLKDLYLEGWYPQLNRHDETQLHKTFSKERVGEFHRLEDLPSVIAMLDSMGEHIRISESSRRRAERWGYRQIKRAKRIQKKRATFV